MAYPPCLVYLAQAVLTLEHAESVVARVYPLFAALIAESRFALNSVHV